MPHPHTPESPAAPAAPAGDPPVIKNDLYTPQTLTEDPPDPSNPEGTPAPRLAGNPEETPPETPPEPPAGSELPATPDFRFKDQAEAERGYRHVQSHASRIEQENKTLRETLEAQQAEEAATRERAARDTQFRKYASERRAQLMKEINELDPDAENNAEELGRLYAEADADIFAFQQNPPDLETPPAGDTPPEGRETPKSSKTTLPPATPTLEEQDAAYKTIISATEAVGLTYEDPTFQGFSAKAPTHDEAGNPIPLDQQAEWAITQTRDTWLKHLAGEVHLDPDDPALQHFVNVAPKTDAKGEVIPLADRLRVAIRNTQTYHATQRSQAVQETGAPLTTGARFGIPPGGSPPGEPQNTEAQPITLSAALAKANQHRTL